jgi:hypothetical protein
MSNLVILSTAAHEVNNLDPIVLVKHSLAPLTTSHDLAVEFNRNSRRGQIELSD